jgi:hypothetical protein
MNVIAAHMGANVFEPIYSSDLKQVINYSVSPVIGWIVSDSGNLSPITCTGQPAGHYMIKFCEAADFYGYVHVPQMLETLSPWVEREDGESGLALLGVSGERIVKTFQRLLEIA